MSITHHPFAALLVCASLTASFAGPIGSTNLPSPVEREPDPGWRTAHPTLPTTAYERAALKLLVREANSVAQELNLAEPSPITEKDMVGRFIGSPALTRADGAIGNITTRHFRYYVSVDFKFSYLESAQWRGDLRPWIEHYSWPLSQMDTNAAYEQAKRWLAAIQVDVEALDKDCRLHVQPVTPKSMEKEGKFVPVYFVHWTEGDEGHSSAASVMFCAATKSIIQLRVERGRYILRKPLPFAELGALAPSQAGGPTNSAAH